MQFDANRNAEAPENWVQWAHWIFSPSSLHIIQNCAKNCTMKVEFSYRKCQKLYSALKIFTTEGPHSKSWFKSGGPQSRIWILATNLSMQWWCYGPEKRNQYQRGSSVTEIFVIQAWGGLERQFHGYSNSLWPISAAERFRPLPVIKGVVLVRKSKRDSNEVDGCLENWETLSWCSTMTRGEQPRKSSSSPIRGAERFRPLHKLRQVKSVRKIETGLERGQRLPRKLRNTVLLVDREKKWARNRRRLFARRNIFGLCAFQSSFNFPDRCNSHKRMRCRKHSAAQIGSNDDFKEAQWLSSPLVMLLHQHSDSLFSQLPLTSF
jgi:hypothetical protein